MPQTLQQIYQFLAISEAIATAGQPTAEQLTAIQQAGYHVVINLALPTSDGALPDEAGLVHQLGMEYIAIPVTWEQPTPEDCDRFFAALDQYQDQRIFVHCAANMRVSAFMYLYRRLRQGTDEAIAQADLRRIWQPNATWQAFIDRYLQTAKRS
ncbi:MAG TPA: protein tyrosine phosphatase family protein [Candidatus Obscuribacterales bacterium]